MEVSRTANHNRLPSTLAIILRYSEGSLPSRASIGGDPSEYLRMMALVYRTTSFTGPTDEQTMDAMLILPAGPQVRAPIEIAVAAQAAFAHTGHVVRVFRSYLSAMMLG